MTPDLTKRLFRSAVLLSFLLCVWGVDAFGGPKSLRIVMVLWRGET